MLESDNKNIIFNSQKLKTHSKASEVYVDVTFLHQGTTKWSGWIPTQYRRTGVNLSTESDIVDYVENIYNIMTNLEHNDWLTAEEQFWDSEKPNAHTTREFFNSLAKGGWQCRVHSLPDNPNFARRIQDLKEFGYTISTDTHKFCQVCNRYTTQLIMLPIPRISIAGNGYETWSPKLRKRIMNVLRNYDAYEGKISNHLLPDHKFSEIRWDSNTKGKNPEDMSDIEIIEKFQLMTNQRNQQKREVCRNCFNTGHRGYPFGIKYYYNGTENWDNSIPPTGEQAKNGCVGCGWYDLETWRKELMKKIDN